MDLRPIWAAFFVVVGIALTTVLGYFLGEDPKPVKAELPKEYKLNENVRGIEYTSPSGKICNWVYQSPSGAGGLNCIGEDE